MTLDGSRSPGSSSVQRAADRFPQLFVGYLINDFAGLTKSGFVHVAFCEAFIECPLLTDSRIVGLDILGQLQRLKDVFAGCCVLTQFELDAGQVP